jgi:ribonuclease HI
MSDTSTEAEIVNAQGWCNRQLFSPSLRSLQTAEKIRDFLSSILAQSELSHVIHRNWNPQGEPKHGLDGSTKLTHGVSRNGMPELVAYVDGGSHGNPGPSGIGVIIEHPDGKTTRIARWIGHQDNNVAEYVALLEALQHALKVKAKALRVYSDSQIVVKQMTGQYVCRSPRLYTLNWTCRKLARCLDFSITHIDRERNAEANDLARAAVRLRTVLTPAAV